ncbi:YcxB family protein [Alkaliphilus sp. B6464]|uniref:YcxB family protein n=1 Tax=Alkaliphilus sp. B6464 TaxID=2731219 RepID=UPI0020127F8E|nr:YcxB family protein [Alkaliphilus sp. B6464]
MFILIIIVIYFRVERKNKQRVSTDKTGTFGSVAVLEFYDDKVVFGNESLNSKGELRYEQFFQLLESKDYFIFYLNVNQASLVRKKDVKDIEKFKSFIIPKFENRFKKTYYCN